MRRFRSPWIATICLVLSSSTGCKKSSNSSESERPSEVRLQQSLLTDQDEPPPLVFDIKPLSAASTSANSQLYDCTYQSGGATARFRLQFAAGAMSGEIPMAPAEGKFLAVAGSNDAMLLEDLKKILEAKQSVRNTSKVPELAFDAVVLGQKQSRRPSGSYSNHPPGDWTVTKIFLPKGGDEGEVFFNFNPVLGKAEFSIKDPDYGDYVLRELAKVL